MATRSTPAAAATTPNYTGPFITVAVLFFIFGFITNLNMALVPHLRNIFTLPYAWAMLAESAFFLAYFVFSSPTSKLFPRRRRCPAWMWSNVPPVATLLNLMASPVAVQPEVSNNDCQ